MSEGFPDWITTTGMHLLGRNGWGGPVFGDIGDGPCLEPACHCHAETDE